MTKRLVVFSVAVPDVSGNCAVTLGVWDGVSEPEAMGVLTLAEAEANALRRLLLAAPLMSDRAEVP